MSQEYAKSKPAGFKNQIENIAIVGVSFRPHFPTTETRVLLILGKAAGQVGTYIVEALVKTGKHQVTAITREDSTIKVPAGVITKKVNYDDPESL